jgi:hypothetical protein
MPGSELDIRVVDGRIEIEPAPLDVKLAKRGSLTVAVPSKHVTALSKKTVAETVDRLRRGREKDPDRKGLR